MSRAFPDRPVVGVLAVVWRGGRVLLVRRANPPQAGRWGFPGGSQELGETVAEAALRELREETGIEAEAQGVVTALDVIEREEGRVRWHYTLLAVLACWRAGEGAAADDASALAWVRPEELPRPDMPLCDEVEQVIRLSRARLGTDSSAGL